MYNYKHLGFYVPPPLLAHMKMHPQKHYFSLIKSKRMKLSTQNLFHFVNNLPNNCVCICSCSFVECSVPPTESAKTNCAQILHL